MPGTNENMPLTQQDRTVQRKRMDGMRKPDVISDFTGIVSNLTDVSRRMRRLQVLPPGMDLTDSIRMWNDEMLGRAVATKNTATGEKTLIDYILPVDVEEAFLIVLNNGMVRKGQVTQTSQL